MFNRALTVRSLFCFLRDYKAENAEYDHELHDSVLDGVAIAGKRFDWMLGRLKVS
ncbi:MAG: hypothetical protein ACYTXE_29770 [Nostoc sp.]|uniref:hypothetical protein n=1 Tax=Nostoc sp. TaxID=1180 RepID=UPI002FF521CF